MKSFFFLFRISQVLEKRALVCVCVAARVGSSAPTRITTAKNKINNIYRPESEQFAPLWRGMYVCKHVCVVCFCPIQKILIRSEACVYVCVSALSSRRFSGSAWRRLLFRLVFFSFCYSHSFRRYLCNKCVRAKWSAVAAAADAGAASATTVVPLVVVLYVFGDFRLSLFVVVVKFVMKPTALLLLLLLILPLPLSLPLLTHKKAPSSIEPRSLQQLEQC